MILSFRSCLGSMMSVLSSVNFHFFASLLLRAINLKLCRAILNDCPCNRSKADFFEFGSRDPEIRSKFTIRIPSLLLIISHCFRKFEYSNHNRAVAEFSNHNRAVANFGEFGQYHLGLIIFPLFPLMYNSSPMYNS